MSIEPNEAEALVAKLNNEIYEQTEGNIEDALTYRSAGNGQVINFSDVPMWDSENDERDEVVDTGELEPIEPFLRAKINLMIGELSKIKL